MKKISHYSRIVLEVTSSPSSEDRISRQFESINTSGNPSLFLDLQQLACRGSVRSLSAFPSDPIRLMASRIRCIIAKSPADSTETQFGRSVIRSNRVRALQNIGRLIRLDNGGADAGDECRGTVRRRVHEGDAVRNCMAEASAFWHIRYLEAENSRGKVTAKNLSGGSRKPSCRKTKLCTSFLADPTWTS